MRFRERVARFLQGRNGLDQFSRALSYVSLAMLIVAFILQAARVQVVGNTLWWLALAVMAYGYFRIFSKNISRRSRENAKYLQLRARVTGWFRRESAHAKQLKTHRFFKCPGCGQRVRTPRGKGKIRITCPKCGTAFIRKS